MTAFGLGCSNSEDSEAAIAAAIDSHLGLRTDLGVDRMRVEIAQVKFQGDEATAAVTITARDDPDASMQMMYRLTRVGDGWKVQAPRTDDRVTHGAPSGSEPGSVKSDLPAGHPPLGGQPEDTRALPSGHPPLNESRTKPSPPPGHPR